ncbi:hypothetical protein IJI91_03360 [Candidatus Saccharibacteria bacterium]|nr:hypothetical protein [Candidatus Saccharibacteria bacterium]
MKNQKLGKIIISAGHKPWPHEFRVAEILAINGYKVEFLLEISIKSPDILLDGTEYELKSPETKKTSSIEQILRRALKQSPNIIIDASRIKMREDKVQRFLIRKCREQKQIKRMLFITKKGNIIDIFGLI